MMVDGRNYGPRAESPPSRPASVAAMSPGGQDAGLRTAPMHSPPVAADEQTSPGSVRNGASIAGAPLSPVFEGDRLIGYVCAGEGFEDVLQRALRACGWEITQAGVEADAGDVREGGEYCESDVDVVPRVVKAASESMARGPVETRRVRTLAREGRGPRA